MPTEYPRWSGPSRQMALALDAAVRSAQAGSVDAFAAARQGLRRVDAQQLNVLLGVVVTNLLERAHPDGLDSDDAEQVLTNCAAHAAWFPQLDRDELIRALTGALGVGDPDEDGDHDRLIVHGLLLTADLLTGLGADIEPILDAALAELMRAQTVEMP